MAESDPTSLSLRFLPTRVYRPPSTLTPPEKGGRSRLGVTRTNINSECWWLFWSKLTWWVGKHEGGLRGDGRTYVRIGELASSSFSIHPSDPVLEKCRATQQHALLSLIAFIPHLIMDGRMDAINSNREIVSANNGRKGQLSTK